MMSGVRGRGVPLSASDRQRALLWLGAALIALSVVCMHMLSGNHILVRSAVTGGSGHATTLRAPVVEAPSEHPATGAPALGMATTASVVHASASCPSTCDGHGATLVTCVLALALLVVAWTTFPRARRLVVRFTHDRTRPRISGLWRRSPALTLAQLSVLRT